MLSKRMGTVVQSHNNKECWIAMAKIATVITNMFEDAEYISPKGALEAAGHELITIDTTAGIEVEGKHGEKVKIDKDIDEVNASEFDALFIPGGFSPDILRVDDRVVAFVKEFMDEMKPTFAICHGPQLLITAKTLNGRDVTGYKSIRVDLENAGAIFHDEEVFVCQKQLVTSRTPEDLPAFNREIVKLLESNEG